MFRSPAEIPPETKPKEDDKTEKKDYHKYIDDKEKAEK